MDPVRVLYIAGSGRSGSTVLARVLGQADGAFAAGEVRYVWERGLRDDRLCGCGRAFSACDLWCRAVRHAVGRPGPREVAGLVAAGHAVTRVRRVPGALVRRRAPARGPGCRALRAALARLYAALRDASGCALLIDSSKNPLYALLLDGIEEIDLRVVHLVRDPRAVAFSWSRAKALPDAPAGARMQRLSPARSAALWATWNVATERLWRPASDRYLPLRYDDFVASPRACVERVLAFAGVPCAADFVDGHTVRLGRTHMVAGNPNRLERGPVELRADSEWLAAMRRRDRLLVDAVTAPLRWRRDPWGPPRRGRPVSRTRPSPAAARADRGARRAPGA